VRFSKVFAFADDRTRGKYQHAATDIQSRNRWRDTHMDFTSGFNVKGYRERKLCLRDPEQRPFWYVLLFRANSALVIHSRFLNSMNMGWFCLASWLLSGYCFRSWLDASSVKQRFQYVKRVKCF